MKTNFFKYLMFIPLVCFVAACSDDEPTKEPLPEAFLEFKTATDAGLIFKGDAQEVIVELNVNRELEIEKGDAAWVTTTPTVNDDNTVSLKIAVAQSDATKRRTATLTLTTQLADETDKAATPLTITIEQSPFGLPDANLLNLVFDAPGNGPNSARDISPLANPVYDVLHFSGLEPSCEKVYPSVDNSNPYGVTAAHFAGSNSCLDKDDKPRDNRRGSCAYRVDIVDYSQYTKHSVDKVAIPFNALGTAMTTNSFSVEVIFKAEERDNDDGKVIGFTQSWGGAVGTVKKGDAGFEINFYMDMNEDHGSVTNTTEPKTATFSETTGEAKLFEWGKYYHVVAVYDRDKSKNSIYVDGVKGKDEAQFTAGYGMKLATTGTSDALGQWIAIGGDARRSDPVVPSGVHINSDYENWAEAIFKGEVVIARMYSGVLTADEVKILYDYEKPEAK